MYLIDNKFWKDTTPNATEMSDAAVQKEKVCEINDYKFTREKLATLQNIKELHMNDGNYFDTRKIPYLPKLELVDHFDSEITDLNYLWQYINKGHRLKILISDYTFGTLLIRKYRRGLSDAMKAKYETEFECTLTDISLIKVLGLGTEILVVGPVFGFDLKVER
ncbi:MAG: hypothetical protein ACPG5B_16310 [Chitinophagales bacterium]